MKEIISDLSGQFSSVRVLMLLVALIVLGTWCYLSVITKQMVPFSEDIKWVLGTVFGGKLIQTIAGK